MQLSASFADNASVQKQIKQQMPKIAKQKTQCMVNGIIQTTTGTASQTGILTTDGIRISRDGQAIAIKATVIQTMAIQTMAIQTITIRATAISSHGSMVPSATTALPLPALIIGILSILPCCLFPYIGIPMNIVGLVLGIIGYRKPYGRGMSIAAIVVNIIFLVLAIVWLVICLYIYANIDMNAYYQMFEDYMY